MRSKADETLVIVKTCIVLKVKTNLRKHRARIIFCKSEFAIPTLLNFGPLSKSH